MPLEADGVVLVVLVVEEDVVETDGEDAGEGSIDQENEDTETDDDDKTKGDD